MEAAVKFKWKLGQTADERKVFEILTAIKEDPAKLSAETAKTVLDTISANPVVFTPLLQDVLSQTVKANYFLLPHQYEFIA